MKTVLLYVLVVIVGGVGAALIVAGLRSSLP